MILPRKLVADCNEVPEDGGDEHNGGIFFLSHLSVSAVSASVAVETHTDHSRAGTSFKFMMFTDPLDGVHCALLKIKQLDQEHIDVRPYIMGQLTGKHLK